MVPRFEVVGLGFRVPSKAKTAKAAKDMNSALLKNTKLLLSQEVVLRHGATAV